MLNREVLNIIGEALNLDEQVSLEAFRRTFADLIVNKKKFKNAYLTLYIYEKFCKTRDVQTRKTSARDFEDFLSAISGGIVADSSTRHNSNDDNIFVENQFITEWVVNNKREKADIIYENGYKLTIKTLVEDNRELNMGSFEKKALFSELNVVQFLEERVSSNDGVGLGSKPQLLNLLNVIKENGDWDRFSERFISMSDHIFDDDLILFIKSSENPRVFLINSEIFKKKLVECVETPESFVTLVNRWEGNSIRIDREVLISGIEPIILDFSYLNEHIVSFISSNISKITKRFILYIEDYDNKEIHRQQIKDLCEETLSNIDNNISDLI
jgi:hypothetical protein